VRRTTAFFRLLFLTAIVAGWTCAAAAQTPDSWISLTSNHFNIAGNAPAASLTRTAERLEQFRWAFSQVYPDLKLDNGRPIQIVVFKDADSYFGFLPRRTDGSVDVGVAGYFQPGENRNYITFAISQAQADPFSTVVHEYVHALIDANFDRSLMPPWLSEGLAEYFETTRFDETKGIIFGDPQGEHLRLLRRSTLIPLSEMVSVSASELKTISTERRRLYYAESWALVNTLILTGKLSLADVGPAVTALSADQKSLAAIEQDMIRNIREASLPPQTVAATTAEPPVSAAASALSEQRINALLGDLLQHTGEDDRASILLKSAVAAQKDDLLANESLGILLARQEKWSDASLYLKHSVDLGSRDHLAIFLYAYSLLNDLKKDGSISTIPDATAETIRNLLKRVSELAPDFADVYRLMATVDLIRDEHLDDAVGLLQKALAIKKDDAELQLLLARILLRKENAAAAKQIAQQVAATALDTRKKAEADEIVRESIEYIRAVAAAAEPTRMNIVLGGRPLVVLKRSWLTDEDVAQIDRERANNNYNLLILRPAVDELQIVGRIEKITCSGSSIFYRVRAPNARLDLTSTDFSSVKLTVAKEGDHTFQIGCGASLEKQLAVLNYRPASAAGIRRLDGTLSAISFVGDDFRLKSNAELSAARVVAIDDDTLRSGSSAAVTSETIRISIMQSLRKPQKDEQRIAGKIENVECSSGAIVFSVRSNGKTYRLTHSATAGIYLRWFTVASTQLPVTCGSGPIAANTLVTFAPAALDSANGELRSIEFIPDDLRP